MGGGRGGDFGNTKGKYFHIENNVRETSKKYKINEQGYFGDKGKNVRVIKTTTPIKTSLDFYQKLSQNGKTTALPNGKGTKSTLKDGTIIVHRTITSTKNSPAVEITIFGSNLVKKQKIHFILEE